MVVPAVRAVIASRHLPPPRPCWAKVPAFALTDSVRPDVSRATPGRQVWIANFIFTPLPHHLPDVHQRWRATARSGQLGETFHLVSFTVDPEHDTPAVPEEYGPQARSSRDCERT